MDSASLYGNIAELERLRDNGQIDYSDDAIDFASQKGCIDVLNWWLHSGLKLEYTRWAISWASLYWKMGVLEWWIQSGLLLKYTKDTIWALFRNNHIFMINHLIGNTN